MRTACMARSGSAKGFIALALAVSLCLPPTAAFAVTDNIDADAMGLQKTVETTAEEYNEATKRVEELNQQIEDNKAQIEEFDGKIEKYREVCSANMVDLYKLQRDGASAISMILSSQDLSAFVNTFYYFNRIQESTFANLARLSELTQERKETQEALETAKEDAEREQERAKQAAEEAARQREEAQKAAEEKARQEAEAAKAQGDGSEETASSPSFDGADWSQDKASFVRNWAGRLDAYLAGSALAGHGKTFAAAAWDAGIDPRFSAAIAAVESNKGSSCFRPYNAWGWGSVSWGSWEEAIPAHAYGLARGYGYTVSVEGAKKYASDWEFWYRRVSEEMEKI